MNNVLLYENIKRICKSKGKTIRQLESDLDISYGSIARFKTATPSISRISDIAEYLAVSLDELVYGNKDDTKQSDSTDNIDNNATIKNKLLSKIKYQTVQGLLDWDIYGGRKTPSIIERLILSSAITNSFIYDNYDVFYTEIDGGYFILSAQYNDEFDDDTIDIKLFTFSKKLKMPRIINSRYSDLESLYSLLKTSLEKKLVEKESDAMLNNYINN